MPGIARKAGKHAVPASLWLKRSMTDAPIKTSMGRSVSANVASNEEMIGPCGEGPILGRRVSLGDDIDTSLDGVENISQDSLEGRELLFHGRENYGLTHCDECGDSAGRAYERYNELWVTHCEDADLGEEQPKRRWSQRLSETVFDAGREAKKKVRAWWRSRQDSRLFNRSKELSQVVDGGDSHAPISSAKREDTVNVHGHQRKSPNGTGSSAITAVATEDFPSSAWAVEDVNNKDECNFGESLPQCLARGARGAADVVDGSMEGMLRCTSARENLHGLKPAHKAWTPPEAESRLAGPSRKEYGRDDGWARCFIQHLEHKQQQGLLDRDYIQRRFEQADGNNTVLEKQTQASIQLLEQMQREKRERDRIFEQAEAQGQMERLLHWPRRESQAYSLKSVPVCPDGEHESLTTVGEEIAAAAGLAMRLSSGTIAVPF